MFRAFYGETQEILPKWAQTAGWRDYKEQKKAEDERRPINLEKVINDNYPWVIVEIENFETGKVEKKRKVNVFYTNNKTLSIKKGNYRWIDHNKDVKKLCNEKNPSREGYLIKRFRGPDPWFDKKLIDSFTVDCLDLENNVAKNPLTMKGTNPINMPAYSSPKKTQ